MEVIIKQGLGFDEVKEAKLRGRPKANVHALKSSDYYQKLYQPFLVLFTNLANALYNEYVCDQTTNKHG